MTKNQYISSIRTRLTGGIPDRTVAVKFDDRIIQRYMDVMLETMLNDYVEAGNMITDDFIKIFYPFLLWDDCAEVAYSNIPASMVQLRGNAGLQWVSGKEETTSSWYMIPNISYQVYSNMESGKTADRQICYIEGSKIIFPNIRKSQTGICIKVKIFCGTNGYTMDEEFKVPSKPAIFIDGVCKLLGEMKLTKAHTTNTGDPNA